MPVVNAERTPMTRRLPMLACAAALSAVGVAALPSGALAESCTPPPVSSYHVNSLHAHGIACDTARHLLQENLNHSRHHGYACTHQISGRNVNMTCKSGEHSYTSSYRVH